MKDEDKIILTATKSALLSPIILCQSNFQDFYQDRGIPFNISKFSFVQLKSYSKEDVAEVAERINKQISSFEGEKAAIDEIKQGLKENIESSAPDYINATRLELRNREGSFRNISQKDFPNGVESHDDAPDDTVTANG